MTIWPDRHTNILPTRAYFRSVLEQTIPARRASISDSVEHFHEATATDDSGWADMAFLGVIGDTLQILEDLAYVGESFTHQRLGALPFYVGAITYDGSVPTRFYQRKRTDDDLRVLAGYTLRDPNSGKTADLLDIFDNRFSEATRAAWREAEDITIMVLREMLRDLADTWSRFGKYFHAFKHGGLVANRDDYELFDQHGNPREAAIAVWVRQKNEPSIHGDAGENTDIQRIVRDLRIYADVAFEVLDLVITSRLGASEHAVAHEPDPADKPVRVALPIRFKLGKREISDTAKKELEAIGFTFSRVGSERGA